MTGACIVDCPICFIGRSERIDEQYNVETRRSRRTSVHPPHQVSLFQRQSVVYTVANRRSEFPVNLFIKRSFGLKTLAKIV